MSLEDCRDTSQGHFFVVIGYELGNIIQQCIRCKKCKREKAIFLANVDLDRITKRKRGN